MCHMNIRPIYTCRLRPRVCLRLRQIYIVLMEMDRLTSRMGSGLILLIKQSIPIGIMINFNRDGDGDGTCK